MSFPSENEMTSRHQPVFNGAHELAGDVPQELLERGFLGRGVVVSVQRVGFDAGPDHDPSQLCVFTVEVALDSFPRYTATCRQPVRASVLPQLMMPRAMVAVRVDPSDRSRVALSLRERPPIVTVASSGDRSTGSAARILELGVPCKAVIAETHALGLRNPRGDDMYAFMLTVIAEGRPPYQVRVGNPVPSAAMPLLYPGNTVPAKRMADGDDHEVVIDWDTALARLAASTA
jgi:hypothetical protein